MKKSLALASAAIGTLTVGALISNLAQAEAHQPANTAAKEKCYGVVKQGKNDCGTKSHSCAGHATTARAADEWVFVPKGLCDRLEGGTTQAPADATAPVPAN